MDPRNALELKFRDKQARGWILVDRLYFPFLFNPEQSDGICRLCVQSIQYFQHPVSFLTTLIIEAKPAKRQEPPLQSSQQPRRQQ